MLHAYAANWTGYPALNGAPSKSLGYHNAITIPDRSSGNMLELVLAMLGPIALLTLALWTINRHFRRFDGFRHPALLGLVIDDLPEFEFTGPTIGQWGNHRLYEFVVVRNRRFDYDRIVPKDYRYRVAPDELFVAPGMLYVVR